MPFVRPFVCSTLEPLAHEIRNNDRIKGLKLGSKEIKISLYADDATTFLRDEASAHELSNLLEDFRACFGLKTNVSVLTPPKDFAKKVNEKLFKLQTR